MPTITVKPKRVLTPFMSIKTGGLSRAVLIRALKARCLLGHTITGIFERGQHFPVSEDDVRVDLVALTPRELGFRSDPKWSRVLDRERLAKWSARHLANQVVEFCEQEDGLHLRLQYDAQPSGNEAECVVVSEPFRYHAGKPHNFDQLLVLTGKSESGGQPKLGTIQVTGRLVGEKLRSRLTPRADLDWRLLFRLRQSA